MLTDVSYVRTASIRAIIALMIEAVHTSETSVNINLTTKRYIPEYFNFILAAVRTLNLTTVLLDWTWRSACLAILFARNRKHDMNSYDTPWMVLLS
jgi:hypothetical protein